MIVEVNSRLEVIIVMVKNVVRDFSIPKCSNFNCDSETVTETVRTCDNKCSNGVCVTGSGVVEAGQDDIDEEIEEIIDIEEIEETTGTTTTTVLEEEKSTIVPILIGLIIFIIIVFLIFVVIKIVKK